jgi:hypothetical protein
LYISYHILSPLPEIFAPYQDDTRKHFVIHADNVRSHSVKTVTQLLDHNSRRRAHHHPYSPDLVASDFWLFAYLKGVLQGSSFDKPDESDELLFAIEKNLRGVDCEILDTVFQEWMILLENCIDGNGESLKCC